MQLLDPNLINILIIKEYINKYLYVC
jgi:hypothetical protein